MFRVAKSLPSFDEIKTQNDICMGPEEAADLIFYNQIVRNASVSGIMKFPDLPLDHAVNMQNCKINHFDAQFICFNKKVTFFQCQFKLCDFSYTYFPGGLEIVECLFKSRLDFQSGGHNKAESTVKIENSTFNGFVNFFDCSYDGPFILRGNKFHKGTNVIGNKGFPYETTFIVQPVFEFNIGALDISGEELL